MKIPVTLSTNQKRVLQLLNELGELPYDDLAFVYYRCSEAEWDIKKLPAILREHASESNALASSFLTKPTPDYSFLWKGRKLSNLEKDLLGLQFAGLVLLELPKSKDNVLAPGDFDDATVVLTKDGATVAQKIKEGRPILLRQKPSMRNTIFVAMAFSHMDLDALYETDIIPPCQRMGYICIRIDREEPHQTITDSIITNIMDAACVIADLTFARPSVYFEVGFALALGVPLLLTCKSDHYRGQDDNCRVHFDLEQFKISYWNTSGKKVKWAEGMSPSERIDSLIPKCS